MPYEREVPAWLAENIAQFDSIRVDQPMPAREVRRRSVRRRRYRSLSAAVAAVAVVAVGTAAYWNHMNTVRSAEDLARPAGASEMEAAREKLQDYYSALPEAFNSKNSAVKLEKLMAVNFTDAALMREVALEGMGSGNRAAVCGPVTASTTFAVGVLSSVRADTVRARVTSSSGPESIDVEFDLRAMKISEWACGNGD